MWVLVPDAHSRRDGVLRVSSTTSSAKKNTFKCTDTLNVFSWYYVLSLHQVEWALLTRKMKFSYAHVSVHTFFFVCVCVCVEASGRSRIAQLGIYS